MPPFQALPRTRQFGLARTVALAEGLLVCPVVCSRHRSFLPACLFVSVHSFMQSFGAADMTVGLGKRLVQPTRRQRVLVAESSSAKPQAEDVDGLSQRLE
jgi:hypothetical protein